MLADKLHMPVQEVMSWDSSLIYEWMAYELTLDQEWREKNEKDAELERQRNMSNEEKAELFRKLFKGKT